MALLLMKFSWMNHVSRKTIINGKDLLCGSQEGGFCIWGRGAVFSTGRGTRSAMTMTCAVVSEETGLIGTKCACL